MKRILVLLALVGCVGCTKYTPFANSPQAHLDMGGHLPLNVQNHLRPMYRSCTPDELVDLKTVDQIEQREFKCSAIIIQHEDWVHLINWEAPADRVGQAQGALAAGLAALRAAQKYKIATGTLEGAGRSEATWQTNAFQFCEVHPTDADAMNWEKGKCWNTPKSVAEVKPPKQQLTPPPPDTNEAHDDEWEYSYFLAHGNELYATPGTNQPRLFRNKDDATKVLAGLGNDWTLQSCDMHCQNLDSRFSNADWR
ncbi:MAG TPA: hypothetical protein VFA89_20840 [Terriglobales bacterium]|nr:hypothetical protein [Terriglobales bacterium]